MKQSVIEYAKETGRSLDEIHQESRELEEYGQWLEDLNDQRIKEQGVTDAFIQKLTKMVNIPKNYLPLFRAIKKEYHEVFLDRVTFLVRYEIPPNPPYLLLMYLNEYL